MGHTLEEISDVFEPNGRQRDLLVPILLLVLAVHFAVIYFWPYAGKQPELSQRLEITLLPTKQIVQSLVNETSRRPEKPDTTEKEAPPDIVFQNPDQLTDLSEDEDIAERALQQVRQMAKKSAGAGTQPVHNGLETSFEGANYFQNSLRPGYQRQTSGIGTEKIGKYCYQQRGDLNAPSTWRWYRVRKELCGHL